MKLKNLIALGILGVLTLGVGIGVNETLHKANAEDLPIATFSSDTVVTDSGYGAYADDNWILTFGGNNKSGGTNSKSRKNCNLSSYSNYADGVNVTTTKTAFGIANVNPLSGIGKITIEYTGGSNYSRGTLFLNYSTDNTTFSPTALNVGEQGMKIDLINNVYTLVFNELANPTYFALIIADTGTSGNFRFDEITVNFYGAVEVVPVESITSNITDLTVYQGERFNIGDRISVSVLPENATLKTYSYSLVLGNPDIHCAEIDSTGYLKVYVAGTATIVITANDGSGVTEEINLNCVNDPALSLVYSGTPVAQKSGQPFDPTGLTFELTYEYKENTVVDSSDITFEPSIISNDTTVVTAKYGTLDPIEIKDIVVEVGPAYVLSIESGTNFITGSTLVGSTNETLYVENSNLGNDGLYWSAEVIPNDGAEASISPNYSELQFGKSGNVVKTANLTSEIFNFNNKNLINKVVVKAIGAASNSGFDVSVAIDGISLTSGDNSISGNNNAKELVFTASEPLFGHVEIKLENTSLNNSSGMKITGIEIYATEDVTNKGLAYAFASKVEKADSCSSDNVALINEYASLSAEVKGIADQIVVYDYAPSVPKSGVKNHQYTVAEKMIYIGNTSNSVSTNGLLNNENSLIITVVVISIVSISIISLFILNKRRYIKK